MASQIIVSLKRRFTQQACQPSIISGRFIFIACVSLKNFLFDLYLAAYSWLRRKHTKY